MNEQSRLDENTYDTSRIYLKTALEHMLEAGRSVRELSEFALDKFGSDFLPYLRQFLHEVGHGRISVKGMTTSTREALSAHTVSSEEREHMIREAAYLRAEARGFCGGCPEQDWLEAEQEIDRRLAQGPGLLGQGGEVLARVASAAEQELASSKQVVSRWLETRFPARKVTARKAPAARPPRGGNGAAPAARKKAPSRETAATKQAVPKKPVKKAAAHAGAAAPAPVRKRTSTSKKAAAAAMTTANRKKTTTKNRAAGAAPARKPRRGRPA